VIKDAIGKVRSYLSNLANWHQAGKKRGKPGLPGTSNHPTLYEGAFRLELDGLDLRKTFVRLKVYTGASWTWINYPVKYNRFFEQRRTEPGWQQQSPKLILRHTSAELHICQTKEIKAKKVRESKRDPDLVTVAVDLNVKNLAVITVRQDDRIIETIFVTDQGLDQHRYWHMKRIAKKQWQSGKPVKGEHSNQQIWGHVRRMNETAAHQVARRIATVCAKDETIGQQMIELDDFALFLRRFSAITPSPPNRAHEASLLNASLLFMALCKVQRISF
jgi:transposase